MMVPASEQKASSSVATSIIRPWSLPPQKTYVLQNVNVVDVVSGTVVPGQTVTLENGTITSIEATTRSIFVGSAHVVDLSGKYVCPGLIDCHVHLAHVPGEDTLDATNRIPDAVGLLRQPFQARQMLMRGFTSVRDCGGAGLALRESIDQGLIAGPRLFLSLQAISQTGGHGDSRSRFDPDATCCGGAAHGMMKVADGVDECLKAAREKLRGGADFIKIMSSGGVASPTDKLRSIQYTDEELQAFTKVAASSGTYVTAHSYTPASIQHSIRNGVRGIEHGNFLDAPTAQMMVDNNVFLTPTLVTYATMASEQFKDYLPPSSAAKNNEVLTAGFNSIKVAKEAGVKMCYGSDLLGPLCITQNHEFGLRAKVLDNSTVLQAATVNAASLLGERAASLGRIGEGYTADLLILDGNPLEDISILEGKIDWNRGSWTNDKLLAVVKDGRVWKSSIKDLPRDVREDL